MKFVTMVRYQRVRQPQPINFNEREGMVFTQGCTAMALTLSREAATAIQIVHNGYVPQAQREGEYS